jgi:putative hydrolase of the HAD superfamily
MLLDLPAIRTDLLAKARNNYRIFLLSNTNVIHISAVMNVLSKDDAYRRFFGLFEKVYFSFEVGMRKPNPDIFRHVLQQHGLNAAETLFIDDSRQHVEGAITAGLHAYHLQDLPLEVIMKDGIIQPSLQPHQPIS